LGSGSAAPSAPMNAPAGPPSASAAAPPSGLFRWGPLAVQPSVSYGLTYADGLLVQPGRSSSSYVEVISAALNGTIGSTWMFNYSPSWTSYSQAGLHDATGQSATLVGQRSSGNLTANFAQAYTYANTTRVETARQVVQQSSLTTAGLSYPIGDKIAWNGSVSASLQFIEGIPDPMDYGGQTGIRLQLSPATQLEFSGRLGYVAVDPGADMAYIEPRVQWIWAPRTSLRVALSAGRESRKTFLAHDSTTIANPSYAASIQYLRTDKTALSISGTRGVSTSYFANQVVENEGWGVQIQQRLLTHFNLAAGWTGSASRYDVPGVTFIPTVILEEFVDAEGNRGIVTSTGFIANGVTIKRKDSVHVASAALSTVLFKRLSIAITFQRSTNHSNAVGFSYVSRQIGANVSFRF
jgi:hypothetical protein